MNVFARKTTQLDLTTNAVQIEDGKPIKVFGMSFSVSGAGALGVVTMMNADESETYLVWDVGSRESVSINIPFIADEGLSFIGSGTHATQMRVTVHHSHPGE